MAQRRSGHVTLLDVARACGFSVSTVSIVLSEAPLSQNVAEKTRQQIRAMAQQLGYHPDAFARSLRRRRSQTIGVLAYDLSDPYCIPIVRGIQAGLQPANYLPLLMDAQTQRGLFDSYLQMILERRAEGVIVIASWVFDETNLLSDVQKNNVPIVIVSRDLTGARRELGAGGQRSRRRAGDAASARAGARRIAVIRGPEEMFDSAAALGWDSERGSRRRESGSMRGWCFNCPTWLIRRRDSRAGWRCARQMLASGPHVHSGAGLRRFDGAGRGAGVARARACGCLKTARCWALTMCCRHRYRRRRMTTIRPAVAARWACWLRSG